MSTKLERQLAAEQALVERTYAQARREHPERDVDAVIWHTEPYYLIPPDMLWVPCAICGERTTIDHLATHIAEHRGYYRCSLPGCFERRFRTLRGYLQHLRMTHHYVGPH